MSIRHAIILSAGQGSRLLPLTQDRPKCLIDFAGKSLLQWQVSALAANGITDISVVTGFRTQMVEAELERLEGVSARAIFNPFYHVADNLGSCWIAREAMAGDFIILNGDTLVSPEIVARLLAKASAPITVTIDVKPQYDADDMKVQREGDRLVAIGKRLLAEQANAESIGMLAFRGEGGDRFKAEVESMMRTSAGVANWYLKAIHQIAQDGIVGTVSIEGLDWAEVDFPADLEFARELAGRWASERVSAAA
ncbi:MAG TPA: phosphocholine cytidylyltransferase family protein [Allosphingosinicella sp.]|nr:phosphocholine cytidylyltransferase family protein [Allosphingosinicella sp.]